MKIRTFLIVILVIAAIAFFIKTRPQTPRPAPGSEIESGKRAAEEDSTQKMSYQIPKRDDVPSRDVKTEAVTIPAGGPGETGTKPSAAPAKAIYDPGIAVPDMKDVEEEIAIREKKRKVAEELVANRR